MGFESRSASRRVNDTIIISPQRADQTTDETVVCNPGVIANEVCGANPLASAKKEKYEHLLFVFLFFYWGIRTALAERNSNPIKF